MQSAFIDRFLHPSLRSQDLESVRLARSTAAIILVLFLCSAALVVLQLALQGTLAANVTAGALVNVFCLSVLKLRGQRFFVANILIASCTWNILGGMLENDGLESSAVPWVALVPMLAVLFLGKRGARFWLFVTLVGLVYVASRAWVGQPIPHGPAVDANVLLGVVMVHVVTFFGIARSFESAKERMALELDRERKHAEAARDQAAEAHRAARRVLDVIDQALVPIHRDGHVGAGLSSAAVRWFGAPEEGEPAWRWLGRSDSEFASWLELAWREFREDLLPAEVTLAQFPQRFGHGGRLYGVRWLPAGSSSELLAVVTDVTEVVEAERAARRQRELVAVLSRCLRDPEGVTGLVDEADAIVADVVEVERGLDTPALLRRLHTLKGLAAAFELSLLAEHCHAIEERLSEAQVLSGQDREALGTEWQELRRRIDAFLARDTRGVVRVERAHVEGVLVLVRRGAPLAELEGELERMLLEPTRERLERAAEQAKALARRLSRGEIRVVVDDHRVALPRELWAPFWAAFTHAVRNAVDHGVEPPEERAVSGKPVPASLWLETRLEASDIVVSVRDDGRGVDWAMVAERAAQRGLPHTTQADLTAALFADGVSTARVVTDVSGRGAGMAALRSATEALGGRIVVSTRAGEGTTFEFRFRSAEDRAAA